jgi:phosphoglycolate phosphatase
MQLRTAIFDFDGTIADTLAFTISTLNSLAAEFGYRTAGPGELDALRALPPREIAARMGLAWHKIPLVAIRARKELTRSMPYVVPFEGMLSALEALRARGVSVGLLTSNSQENVGLFLARHPVHFDFVSTGSGMFSKHRRLASVLRRRKLTKEHTVYVGDELRDLEAGRALGMRVAAVGWGYTAPELLRAQQPDYFVGAPSELVRTLLGE